jgi:hypothetical protein
LIESKSKIAADTTSIPVDWDGITGGNGLRYAELDWLDCMAPICICGMRDAQIDGGYGTICEGVQKRADPEFVVRT